MDKQIKEELKQVVTNLGNIEFTVEDELKFCKEVLKRKEQECEELKKQLMQKSEVDMFFSTPIEGWSSDPCGVCKYKNCLTEIKEIAEVEIECKTYEIENDCFNKTRCKALNEHIDFIKQILQKISECGVKNE